MPRKTKHKLNYIEEAILKTLKYRAVFNAGVSYYQLSTMLISERSISKEKFDRALKNLYKKRIIKRTRKKQYYVGKKPVNWNLRLKNSNKKINDLSEVFKILHRIRWIKLLAISGSVAAYNAKENDDVDIFIIVQKNRLWITRFFVVMYLKKLNLYPTNGKSDNKLCPNIFMSEDLLEWDRSQQNIYSAHEVILLQPIFDRDDMYFKFLNKNIWVFNYFSNFSVHYPKKFKRSTNFDSRLTDILNFISYVFQTWYMKSKKTNEIVLRNFIHFKKNDHMGTVLEKFNSSV